MDLCHAKAQRRKEKESLVIVGWVLQSLNPTYILCFQCHKRALMTNDQGLILQIPSL